MKNKIFFIIVLLFFIINTKIFAIEISSPNAILIDVDSGKILYEKNAYEQVQPASTTKVLTAIIALESCNLNDTATASYEAVMSVPADGSTASIKVGETLTIKQLVETLMVCSANESANILAEHIGGNNDSFASIMNSKAREIGAKSSNFVNPSGLPDDKHVTTAYDMGMIARYGMKNVPILKEIASTRNIALPKTAIYDKDDRTFTNTNKLILPNSTYYYQYATGMKTGYTSKALNCIVATAEKGGVELIVVIFGAIGAENRTNDVKTLFEYGFTKLKGEMFYPKNTVIKELNISGGSSDTRSLDAIIKENIIHSIPVDKNASDYPPEVKIKDGLKAPIESGEIIGTITYNIEGNKFETDLVASHKVESKLSNVVTATIHTTKIIGKIILWAVLFVFVLFALLVLVRARIINKKQKMRIRRRARYNKRFR